MAEKDPQGTSGQPDEERKASPETTEAPRKTVNDLLAEYKGPFEKSETEAASKDGNSAKEAPPASADEDDKSSELRSEVKELREALSRRAYYEDLKPVITTLKGDLLHLPDGFVEYWLNDLADKNQDLQDIWDNRSTNRGKFDELVKDLAPKFQAYAKEFIAASKAEPEKSDKPDKDKGLGAAVRSAKEVTPSTGFDDIQWGALSEPQFALKKAEMFRWMKQQHAEGKLGG